MDVVGGIVELLRRVAQRFGPYVLIEIVLPGGTLLALLLYAYKRRRLRRYSAGDGNPSLRGAAPARGRAPAEPSSLEAAMTAFAGCAGAASSASSVASRRIGANRCPA